MNDMSARFPPGSGRSYYPKYSRVCAALRSTSARSASREGNFFSPRIKKLPRNIQVQMLVH